MEKVYVVSSGDYSDYKVDGIFTSKPLAQKFMDTFKRDSEYSFERFNDIVEFTLNPFEKEIRAGYKPYFLRMTRLGQAYDIRVDSGTYGFEDSENYSYGFDVTDNDLYTHCFAKDEQHAIKICNERRIQIIALDRWGKASHEK